MDVTIVETSTGRLAVRVWPRRGRPLVCLHGFTLNGGMFAALAALLRRPVLAPDLPGHGRTAIDPVDLDATLAALTDWLAPLGPVPVLGYSQGGRVALHLAARHQEVVERLIVVSSGAGLSVVERAERRARDERLAATIEAGGADAFIDTWIADPLTGTGRLDPETRATDRALRRESSAEGLAAALRGLGQAALPPIDLSTLKAPILWVAGELDDKYRALSESLAAVNGDDFLVVPGVGHNVVAEAPEALASAVDRWSGGH